jgi:hypothetical protein
MVVGVVMLVLVQVGRGGEVAGGVDDTRGVYRGGGGRGYGGAGWLAEAEKQVVWLIQGYRDGGGSAWSWWCLVMVVLGHGGAWS